MLNLKYEIDIYLKIMLKYTYSRHMKHNYNNNKKRIFDTEETRLFISFLYIETGLKHTG